MRVEPRGNGWIRWGKKETPPGVQPNDVIDLISCAGREHHGYYAHTEFNAGGKQPYVEYYQLSRDGRMYAPNIHMHTLPLPANMLEGYVEQDVIDLFLQAKP
jgi:hypothetical protein